MSPRLAVVCLGSSLLVGGIPVSGFVSSRFASSDSPKITSSLLFAEDDKILLVKKGLKWILVPNVRLNSDRASSLSTATSSSSEVSPPLDSPIEVDASQFVSPSSPAQVSSLVETSSPGDVVVSQSLLSQTGVSDPVIEIVPRVEGVSRALSEKTDFQQVIQMLRESHWEKLPHVRETVIPSDEKAPLLMDYVMEKGGPSAIYLTEKGKDFLESVKQNVYESGERVQSTLSVVVDPDIYLDLKEKVATGTAGLSLEELSQYILPEDNVRATLDSLKGLFKMDQITLAASSWREFTATLSAVKSILDQADGKQSVADVVRAMNLGETAGWYCGIAALIFLTAVSVASAGPENSRKLVLDKDSMSVTADLSVAMTGAAKQESELESPSSVASDRELVNSEVAKLKSATAAIYEQLNEMKADKEARAYEVATMKSELRSVQNLLDANVQVEKDLRLSLEKAQEQIRTETSYLREQLEQRVAAEDALREELAATKDKFAKEVDKVQRAKLEAEKKVAIAEEQVQQLRQERDEMESQVNSLRAEVEKLREQLLTVNEPPPSQPTRIRARNGEDRNSVLESNVATLAGPKIEDDALPATSYNNVSDVFFASTAEKPGKPISKLPVRPNPPESGTKKFVVKVTSRKPADFSKLSASALKQKTVEELSNYLESKGTPVTGKDGKKLKKDDLIQAILSL